MFIFIHLYLYIAVWELFARDVIIKSCAWQLSTLVEIYTSFPSHPNSNTGFGNSKIFSFIFLLLFPFLIWFSLDSFYSSSLPGNLSNAQIQSMSDIGQEQRKSLKKRNKNCFLESPNKILAQTFVCVSWKCFHPFNFASAFSIGCKCVVLSV